LVKDFVGIQLEIDEVEHDKAFIPSVGSVATRTYLLKIKNRVIVCIQYKQVLMSWITTIFQIE